MAEIQEHMQVANEVSEAISAPMNGGLELDDVRPSFTFYPAHADTHLMSHRLN